MKHPQQLQFTSKTPNFNFSYGGEYRKCKKGRGARPLSTKDSHHIVFKVNKNKLKYRSFRHPNNFRYVQNILNRYAKKFYIKIEQISYQHDHIHIMARSGRRSHFHNFFRVFAGQIAQNLKVTDTPNNNGCNRVNLWKHRPFTRIAKGWRNFSNLKNYILLNEMEVTGFIGYKKNRLKDISLHEWNLLKLKWQNFCKAPKR